MGTKSPFSGDPMQKEIVVCKICTERFPGEAMCGRLRELQRKAEVRNHPFRSRLPE